MRLGRDRLSEAYRGASGWELAEGLKMSWVSLDRFCEEQMHSDAEVRRLLKDSNRPLRSKAVELSDDQLLEKLRGFGLDLDRARLERLCASALSAEEVARRLIAQCDFRTTEERIEGDWIWVCLVSLWQRGWPEKVCLELLDDKIQGGYGELERGESATAAGTWLDAWSDVVRLCERTGIDSIEEFDDRFPMTQSLFNWSQDLEDALCNAGLEDSQFRRARIAVCEDALGRFPDEDRLMVENRRRAVAESYFGLGETDRAEAMFEQWLAADPRWGWGWIGWADLYCFSNRRPKDYGRAEELLRRGYATPGVRDREDIAERLALLYEETGRSKEAKELAGEAKGAGPAYGSGVSVRRTVELVEEGDRAIVRDTATATFEGEGLPLDRLEEIVSALDASRPLIRPARTTKVGRNAPCPCGSGRKFKKCCGSGRSADA
jgi:tetratricopeptide (TPR) repeat protein